MRITPTILLVLATLALPGALCGCDESDGETLRSVFAGDAGDTASPVDTFDAVDTRDNADTDSAPDVVLDIPPDGCASLSISVDGAPAREATAVRCEFARQAWRQTSDEPYLTIVLESEVEADPSGEGTYLRDLVQILMDDVPATGAIELRTYPLRYEPEVLQSFAVYSGSSAWIASSVGEPSAVGEMRGWLTVLAEDGSRGRFEFEATRDGTHYLVRGDFIARQAAARLPEPAVR